MSNATGSFATPVNIGALTSTAAGTISGTIPIGTPDGNDYRVRVVSSNSGIIGKNNQNNLTVNATPSAPTVGVVTQPTCTTTTGSVVLNDLPSGGWKLTQVLEILQPWDQEQVPQFQIYLRYIYIYCQSIKQWYWFKGRVF